MHGKYWLLACVLASVLSGCAEVVQGQLKKSISRYMWLSGKGVNDLGFFNECVDEKNSDYTLIVANFLQVHVNIGLCHPKDCTDKEIKSSFYSVISLASPDLDKSKLSIELINPQKFSNRDLPVSTIMALALLLAYTGLIAYSSFIYSNCKDPKDSLMKTVLIEFSFQKNFNSLVSTQSNNDPLQCLNGIRCLASSSLLLVHILVYFYRVSFKNIGSAVDYATDFPHKFILLFLYNVDVFFLISGLLLSYLVIPEIKRQQDRFSWKWLMIRRFLRCAPVACFVYIFVIFVIGHVGTGPQWPMIDKVFPACEDYWWASFLYLGNLVPFDQSPCVGWAWYVPVDFQFYLFSPVVLIPYMKSKTLGYLSCLLTLIGSFLYIGIISSINDFTPTFLAGYSTSKQNGLLYTKPFSRIPPFIIGLVIGFIYRKHRDQSQKSKSYGSRFEILCIKMIGQNRIRKSLYVVGFALMGWVNFIVDQIDGDKNDEWSQDTKTLFLVFHRTLFTLGFCFVFFPMLFGHAKFVREFLSVGIFQVLAKTSYSLYMVHCIVIMYFYFSRSQSEVVDDSRIFFVFASLITISNVFAFIVAITIEFPVLNFEKKFLRNRS